MGPNGPGGPHDVGGLDDDVSLDLTDRPYQYWERQVHGIVFLLNKKTLLTLDELRRAIEGLSDYDKLTYYERWAAGTTAICLERGTFTRTELERELGPEESGTPSILFKAGDLVRVREEGSRIRWRKPHIRTPGYIYGLVGTIERDCVGLFGDPELKAFREAGPQQPLYRVRFRQQDVWEQYCGGEHDTLYVEIYQPWLEPATPEQLQQQQQRSAQLRQQLLGGQGTDEAGGHQHHHHQHHPERAHHGESQQSHGVIDHGDHVHEAREQVEQAAVEKEGDTGAQQRLAEALLRVLVGKGVISAQELREEVESLDARGVKGDGARLVARAWVDPGFKARLLKDAASAAAELGISTSNIAPSPAAAAGGAAAAAAAKGGTVLTAVENTDKVHNLIVCTLCSCYPLSVLGMSPPWYKSRSYRARAVRDPRGLLAEFGTRLAPDVSIRVHDSTADLRYIVIPARPAGTDGWAEEQLRALITRDSMVGVAFAKEASGPSGKE